MKKLLTLALMLALVISLVGCSLLPEDLATKLEDFKDSIFGGEHTHEFTVTDSKAATCLEDGYEKSACECGETKEELLTATGHDMQVTNSFKATCTNSGTTYYKCSFCGESAREKTDAYGHNMVSPEASRFSQCSNEGCVFASPAFPTEGKFTEILTFTFGDEDKAALEEKHNEMLAILEASDDYNPDSHKYADEGELAESYAAAEAVYEEYNDLIWAARDQYSVAMTLYYCDYQNKELEAIYNDMADYYTNLVSKFYELSQPWYDSMYREFFFYGATEEEINAFLFDSNALANEEYASLQERNTAIELAFNNIPNPTIDSRVPTLYAELVQNNNRMAEILGYDNYLEYAYENVYDREYTYQEVAVFADYVKEYIAPIYTKTLNTLMGLLSSGGYFTDADIEDYYSMVMYSFFENKKSNELFNDYIDDMNMAFTSNPDKVISFSDELNGLASNGNLFRGSYEGAYVTFLYDNKIPIAYFGEEYDTPLTVAHEFGHFMNEVYNQSEYNQSYDLLETHSQGQEMLFIYFVRDHLTSLGYQTAEAYEMYSILSAVISGLRIDCFEQAIYLDSYDGYYADEIMADGTITADEYDKLYASIGLDFGLVDEQSDLEYWRYGMTISSPCYYVSYSVSAINALQIYMKIYNESFDAAKDSYLKLVTYTDVDPEMDMNEVLKYAGLISYKSEELYIALSEFFANKK